MIFIITNIVIFNNIIYREEITAEINKSADRKEEGICFKDPHSVYKPNNRKAGWWKMKLEVSNIFSGVEMIF